MEPFRVDVPQAELDDLRARLRATRWPDALRGSGWDLGTDLGELQELCAYWADGFDWRAQEARLNAYDQHVTTVDGQRVHVLVATSPHPGALPLLMTHGWPGSVVEFLHVLPLLVDPPDPDDAFTVVAPSLPGYCWSGPTTTAGWDIRRVARALADVMAQLGHTSYGAQGGDWGGIATGHLGVLDAEHLVGIHLNMASVRRPPGDLPVTEQEQRDLEAARAFQRTGTAYQQVQGTTPQSLAYGLTDSPAGLAGWVLEKFRAWSDPRTPVDRDDLLANLTSYWVTRTAGSSARLYYETARSGWVTAPERRVEVPTGIARFPHEIYRPPRSWVEAAFDVRRWTEMERGGHFAALEQPEALVDDVRAFFRPLRGT